MEEARQLIEEIIHRERLISGVFSDVRKQSSELYRKVGVKPVRIKGQLRYQFEYHHETKVTHQNQLPEDAKETILRLLLETYKETELPP